MSAAPPAPVPATPVSESSVPESPVPESPVSESRAAAVDASPPERVDLSADHWVLVLRDPSQLDAIADDYDALAAAASTPNVFYERWQLGPAWRTFGGLTHLLLIMRRGNSPAEPPVPLGLFPMQVGRSDSRLLGSVAALWTHPYGFLRTPLLRWGAALEAVDVWSRALAVIAPDVGLALWERLHAEGPLAWALTDWCRAGGVVPVVTQRYSRAACRPVERGDGAGERYQERAIRKKQRRELTRQRKRLADRGVLEVVRPDAATFAEAFLDLEAAGWKGTQQSAIAARQADADFYRTIIHEAAGRGQLDGSLLTLDGGAIAAKLNFDSVRPVGGAVDGAAVDGAAIDDRRAGGGRQAAFACKIAHDESLRKFSPGVLLELATIDRMHQPDAPAVIDSCAKPDHPMIDRLWSERVAMQHVAFALPHATRADRLRLEALRLKTRRTLGRSSREGGAVLRANY